MSRIRARLARIDRDVAFVAGIVTLGALNIAVLVVALVGVIVTQPVECTATVTGSATVFVCR